MKIFNVYTLSNLWIELLVSPLQKPEPPLSGTVCCPEISPRRAQISPPHQSRKSDPNHRTVAVRAHRSASSNAPGFFPSAMISLRPRLPRPNRSAEPHRRLFAESPLGDLDNDCITARACRCRPASPANKSH